MWDFRKLKSDFIALVLLGVTLFVGLSMLSFDPADPPGSSVYPMRAEASNLCGEIGAMLAWGLRAAFGIGAWFLVAALTVTDFRLLRSGPREGLYWGDCEDGHHIAVGGGRIYYTAGTGDPGCSDRSHDHETSVVHVLDAETLEELRAFPTRMFNTVPDITGCTDCPPGAIAIQGEELFLADVSDSSALVQVFHTDGTHLRTIYPPAGAYYDYEGDEIPDDGRPDRRLP